MDIDCGNYSVVMTNININGFRDMTMNIPRRKAVLEWMRKLNGCGFNCLCLPAGYFVVKDEKEIRPLIRPILKLARRFRISFILGVDTSAILSFPEDPNSPKMLRAVRNHKMPCFLCAYSADRDKLEIHRQRSCTSAQARNKILSDEEMSEARFMPLGGSGFQIILCGEVYDERLFDEGRPRAAVVFGHVTMPRLARTLAAKSRLGFSIINTEHRTGRGGRLFCFDKGRERSVVARPCVIGDANDKGPWIDMAVWELDKRGSFRPSKNPAIKAMFEQG